MYNKPNAFAGVTPDIDIMSSLLCNLEEGSQLGWNFLPCIFVLFPMSCGIDISPVACVFVLSPLSYVVGLSLWPVSLSSFLHTLSCVIGCVVVLFPMSCVIDLWPVSLSSFLCPVSSVVGLCLCALVLCCCPLSYVLCLCPLSYVLCHWPSLGEWKQMAVSTLCPVSLLHGSPMLPVATLPPTREPPTYRIQVDIPATNIDIPYFHQFSRFLVVWTIQSWDTLPNQDIFGPSYLDSHAQSYGVILDIVQEVNGSFTPKFRWCCDLNHYQLW